MSGPPRRLSSSSSAGGALVQLVNRGETSPVLLINPVFTITANNWAAACDAAASRRCYPKVRQKSKSSGASPQRHISPGNLGFGEEFINIVTSSESVELEFGDGDPSIYEDYGSHPSSSHSHSRPSSYHSNPYLSAGGGGTGYESRYYYYGSNPKLLQVPSSSTLLLPQTRDTPRGEPRQVRSSSITVPSCAYTSTSREYSSHTPRTPARCSSELFIRRRSSSTSPNKSGVVTTTNPAPPPTRLCSSTHTSPRGRGASLTPFTGTCALIPADLQPKRRASYSSRRRRSSTRPIPLPGSSSSSSLSSRGEGGGLSLSPRRKGLQRQAGLHRDNSHRHELPPRQRTLSMPVSAGLGAEVVASLTATAAAATAKGTLTSKPPTLKKMKVKEQSLSLSKKADGISYDTVIIGSPNVGKSSLAEFFNKGGVSGGGGSGSSGSDQGIGSGEEEEIEEDSYDDQDLLGGGKAILYRPGHHLELNQPLHLAAGGGTQFNFTLRIFCQQISAVNHLYKYDAVIILYSVTDRDSFEFARRAVEALLPCRSRAPPSSSPRKVVILVGNKSDLERSRVVSSLEGRSLATAYDVKFIEVSSSLGVGILQLQKGLATQVLLRHGESSAIPAALLTPGSSRKGRNGSTSSSSTCSSNSSCSYLIGAGSGSNGSIKKRGGPLSSLKLAQKLIDRIMALRIVGGGKTKSCLDLHSL